MQSHRRRDPDAAARSHAYAAQGSQTATSPTSEDNDWSTGDALPWRNLSSGVAAHGASYDDASAARQEPGYRGFSQQSCIDQNAYDRSGSQYHHAHEVFCQPSSQPAEQPRVSNRGFQFEGWTYQPGSGMNGGEDTGIRISYRQATSAQQSAITAWPPAHDQQNVAFVKPNNASFDMNSRMQQYGNDEQRPMMPAQAFYPVPSSLSSPAPTTTLGSPQQERYENTQPVQTQSAYAVSHIDENAETSNAADTIEQASPYYCSEHDHDYKDTSAYNKHMKKLHVHPKPMFPCGHCKKQFADDSYRKKHERTEHSAQVW